MGSSGRGAKDVPVRISGGGRDADGVEAHLEYIDRHGKLDPIMEKPSAAPAGRVTRINPKVKFGHSEDVGEFAQP
jgi:hypothetical protein